MNKCFVVSENFEVREMRNEMTILDRINGQINKDVSSGLIYACDGTNVSVRKSEIGPDGFLASHRAEGIVCICVTNGSGVCEVVEQDGRSVCGISLNRGETIVFENNMPLHNYTAGAEGLEYIAISIPSSR